MTQNIQALELRLDYIEDIEKNLEQIETLITKIYTVIDIPIIITIRSDKEWGNYKDTNQNLIEIMNKMIKLGVEYIDYELQNEIKLIDTKNTVIIGSCHTKDFNILQKILK